MSLVRWCFFFLALASAVRVSASEEVDPGKTKNLGDTLIRMDEKKDEEPIVPSLRKDAAKDDLGRFSPSMLVPRMGFGISPSNLSDSGGFVGLIYGFESESFNPWEVGFDFLLKGHIQVQGGKRWIYFPKDSVRPFVKASLNWSPDPNLGLGNIVDWNRFQVRGGVGLDDLGTTRARIRWEVEAAFSPLQTLFLISVGFPIVSL